MKIAVVTDSTCDLPDELLQENQIRSMRNFIVIDGESLEDGTGITRQDFYTRLPGLNELPTTATASSGAYEELYQQIFEEGTDHIISIHPSIHLSGILNATNTAAQSFPGRVHILDSQMISLGLGFQALEAAEAAVRGLPVEEVLRYLQNLQKQVRVVALLDSLDYVRRSGRVSWARASFGALLSIKAFIEIKEGQVMRLDRVRTRRKAVEHFVKLLREAGALKRLAILHTNAEQEARQILESLDFEVPASPLVVNVTTIIGTHVGPNCLGFAVVTA